MLLTNQGARPRKDVYKRQGVKPVIGCEVYVAPRGRTDREHGVDSELSLIHI